MDDVINDQKIDVDCEECGEKVWATVGQLRRSPTLRCRNGHEIAVDGSQLNRDLKPADDAVDRFNKTIDDFGK